MHDNLSCVRIIPREVVDFRPMDKYFAAYLASFLDADGSIYVQLKSNTSYRYRFQVYAQITFYQAAKAKAFLEDLCALTTFGYIRERRDGICEYIIGDTESMLALLDSIEPYLRLKKEQAQLLRTIIMRKQNITSAQEFVALAELVDRFRELNYSKKRSNTADVVRQKLRDEGLLTP